uniref:Uncharacterized protein n=1 Tax=viral metagenome TaxID=1070528 RepID=A0A6H1ZIX8_9ZZZZ
MEVKIVARYPRFACTVPGCVFDVPTSQDPALPGGDGEIRLDYTAAGPSSQLALRAPGDTVGAYSADLDAGNPTDVTLTSAGGHYVVISAVTSATLAAVVADTNYHLRVVGVGDTLWHDNLSASFKASVEAAVRAGIDFEGADFDGADLSGADLRGMKAAHASFRGANLMGAKVAASTIAYADFTGAKIEGLVGTPSEMTAAVFAGVDEAEEVVGGLSVGSRAVSASDAVEAVDSTLIVTTGSGAAVVLTLPAAASYPGKRFRFIKADAGTTAGQIAVAGAETFSGAASPLLLSTRYHGWDIESDGTNWQTSYLTIVLPLAASEKAAASGVASLSSGSLVVQDPANATATPTAAKIPIADAGGKMTLGWLHRAPTVPGSYPYAVLAADEVITAIEGTGANNVITLPAATGGGREITVVCIGIDVGAGTLQVDPDGTEQINALGAGVAYTALDAVGDVITLKDCAAGQWWVIGGEVS